MKTATRQENTLDSSILTIRTALAHPGELAEARVPSAHGNGLYLMNALDWVDGGGVDSWAGAWRLAWADSFAMQA